ncbi:SAYSvFN domain-containing protein 1-like Protein [Elysia marginata]|uniref:SAYSvFN domain-containing protein 1-like Protein n=1 Tax=Elysia marginata TaxID=1093978 RepID=A0AAV4F0G6_9GAST|nr:SAYSvFN domain-containing protein 1-like Protein [Elysia marginata]
MEAKLAAYRANKAKQKQSEQSFYNRLKARVFGNKKARHQSESNCDKIGETERRAPDNESHSETKAEVPAQWQNNAISTIDEREREVTEPTTSEIVTKWILRLCKIALWLCLWGLFVELGFGAVFFAISAIVFTYFNTRTGPRDGKLSAYSVFNKDCERIQGTLTAEQMQRNMFGVPGITRI